MAKLISSALSALIMISASSSFAAGYGQSYGQQYGQPYAAPQRTEVNQKDPARKVANQLKNLRTFLAKAKDNNIDRAQAMQFIESQITPDVDFATMTRMALGRLAMRMNPQQRAAAQDALRTNFTTKLVETMGDIRATRFTVGRTRVGTSRGELVVPVRLDRWRGQPLSVNFRFYESTDGWKVFDVQAGGQSAVMFYRGYFARQFRANQYRG